MKNITARIKNIGLVDLFVGVLMLSDFLAIRDMTGKITILAPAFMFLLSVVFAALFETTPVLIADSMNILRSSKDENEVRKQKGIVFACLILYALTFTIYAALRLTIPFNTTSSQILTSLSQSNIEISTTMTDESALKIMLWFLAVFPFATSLMAFILRFLFVDPIARLFKKLARKQKQIDSKQSIVNAINELDEPYVNSVVGAYVGEYGKSINNKETELMIKARNMLANTIEEPSLRDRVIEDGDKIKAEKLDDSSAKERLNKLGDITLYDVLPTLIASSNDTPNQIEDSKAKHDGVQSDDSLAQYDHYLKYDEDLNDEQTDASLDSKKIVFTMGA